MRWLNLQTARAISIVLPCHCATASPRVANKHPTQSPTSSDQEQGPFWSLVTGPVSCWRLVSHRPRAHIASVRAGRRSGRPADPAQSPEGA